MWRSCLLLMAVVLVVSCSCADRIQPRRNAIYSNSTSILPLTSPTSAQSPIYSRFSSSTKSQNASDRLYPTSTKGTLSSQSTIPLSSTSQAADNATTQATGACTGCVLQAYPVELSYTAPLSVLTSTIGTVFVSIITYQGGSTTVINETSYHAATKSLPPYPINNVHYTLTWTWHHAPDVTLTAPTTYLAYTNLNGALDVPKTDRPSKAAHAAGKALCTNHHRALGVFPNQSGNHAPFIQPKTKRLKHDVALLPSELIDYLSQLPRIQKIFNGHDIATCTTTYTTEPFFTGYVPTNRGRTTTLLVSTLTSSTIHIQSSGPLRVESVSEAPHLQQATSQASHEGSERTSTGDRQPLNPTPVVPESLPGNLATMLPPDIPQATQVVQPQTIIPPAGTPTIQSITIGDNIVPVRPAPQTQPGVPPGVIIGSNTIPAGQATTINGMTVSVPSNAGGSSIVIGGSTLEIQNPAYPTAPALLTIGSSTVTANPSGQFVIGTRTLSPGGPAITISGTTLSLAPSGSVLVVNGHTQTLDTAPIITEAPVLTINGQRIPATVMSGTTEFIIGPGETLTPGGVLTVGGTTFSLPESASGSVVVINGKTSTLIPGNQITWAPTLTIGIHTYSATVIDGTTEFVLGPGTTLTPGGSVIVSGTTFSLGRSASVVVINGHTSTLISGPARNSASATGTASGSEASDKTTTTLVGGHSLVDVVSTAVSGSKSKGEGISVRRPVLESWVEGVLIGIAGWALAIL